MATWAAGGGGPCDEASFDSFDVGWKGVMCCASYEWSSRGSVRCTGANTGRVTYMDLNNHRGVSGDIGLFGRLVELQYLNLPDTQFVAGNIAALASLVQLQYLDLSQTVVAGQIAALATLVQLQHLDLSQTVVAGDVAALATLGQLQYLALYGYRQTNQPGVWGSADVLRAIPGLGADWNRFTACAAGGNALRTAADDLGQCPAGRSLVDDGAAYVGADECACCSGSQKVLLESGVCLDPSLCVYDSAGVCVGARATPLPLCHAPHQFFCANSPFSFQSRRASASRARDINSAPMAAVSRSAAPMTAR
jgi:hypothetical protein